MPEKKEVMTPLNVKLPSEMRKQLKERAKKRGESESLIVRDMIRACLKSEAA